MNDKNSPELSSDSIQKSASDTVRDGVNIHDRVHDLTLRALRSRRFDRHAIREVVSAVSSGMARGAEARPGEFRQALADAFRGLDAALTQSAEASRQALGQLVATGKDLSDNDIRRALADLKALEEDFLATAGQAAEAASAKVRPELRQLVHTARTTGTATGKAVAKTMAEFAQRFSVASIDLALAGLEVATEVGNRFAQLASGFLSGIADALSPPGKPGGTGTPDAAGQPNKPDQPGPAAAEKDAP